MLQESIKAYDAHLRDAQNRERFGLAARNEVLAVQVERDRVELDAACAPRPAPTCAEANLQRLLDLPAATRVEPTEPLAAPPAGPRRPRGPRRRGGGRAAPSARPSPRGSPPRTPLAGAERGARLPQLALTGGYTYANPNRDIVPPTADWKDTWDVGVGLGWSVFDGGRRSAGEARARAQADAVRAAAARARPRDPPRGHAARARAAHRRARASPSPSAAWCRRPRAAASPATATARACIPSSELLDAEIAHERAALARTEALAALRLAAAGLDRAVGR